MCRRCESLAIVHCTDLARSRHLGTSLNMLFVDNHVEQINSNLVPAPTQNPASGVWSSSSPTLIWGPIAD